MDRRSRNILIALFAVVASLRIFLSFSVPHFSPDAYFHIRMIEHIAAHGTPLILDSFIHGGRVLLFSPLYHYLMAGLSYLLPLNFVLKVVPQLFMSTLPVLVYFIVHHVTKRSDASFFSAFVAAFVPVLFTETLYTVSPLTLTLPLLLVTLYLFLHIEKKLYDLHFILIVLALSLLHPSSIFLVGGLLGFLIIGRLEGITLEKREFELISFSVFLFLWVQFLLYKQGFLVHGFTGLLRQNIPDNLVTAAYSSLSFSGALVQIGVLPLIGGVYCMYKYLFKVKNKYIYMYISLAVTIALLTWLRLVNPLVGFAYLGMSLSILSGPAYVLFYRYIKKMRIARYSTAVNVSLFLLIIPLMVIPSVYFASAERGDTVTDEMMDALMWLRDKTADDSVVVGLAEEGHVITAVAQRQVVLDNYFLLVNDAAQRLTHIERIMESGFPIEVTKLLTLYDVGYVVLSPDAQLRYGVSNVFETTPCLRLVYDTNVLIYESSCTLRVQ